MANQVKGQKVLDSRKEMIKVPTRTAVHINGDGLPVLTFSEGSGKEGYSFMLSKNMAMKIAEALKTAGRAEIQTKTGNKVH